MEAIHKLKVYCPYEILKIENIEISCKSNEHGYLYLKCLIDDSINFKYSIKASTEDKIILYEELEDGEKSIIFNGIIESVRTTNENGIYYLELEGTSSSSLLDMKQKTRSFQDEQMSYDDLINEILQDYKGYGFTQCMSKPMSIGQPLFQYKETDYKFLKRVASLLGLEVICDIINLNNLFYYGRPEGKKYTLEDGINYKACKNLERYHKAQALGIDFHDTDFFYYEVKIHEKMDIGDKIYFKQKDFYISQFEAKLHKGDLIYKYRFCRDKGIWVDKIYNESISGASIEGKVLEVSGEKVKLHLNIDENQDSSKAAWFYYAPPTGNILYSMPLVNESAMLYFSNESCKRPVVTGCVRKNRGTCAELYDTDNRYFATESGNYLEMLPGAINLYRSGLKVNLNDESGITLSSSGNLNVSGGSVSISGGNVSINATSKIKVQKGKSGYISLENEFYSEASTTCECGSDRESYPAFTDDEPTAGVAEALAKKKAELAKQIIDNIILNKGNLLAGIDGSKAILSSLGKNDTDSLPEYDPLSIETQDRVKKKAMNGEYYSGKVVDGYGSKVFIPDDEESYKKADEFSASKYAETVACATGNVLAKTGYDFAEGVCGTEGWIASKVWKDDSARKFWNEKEESLKKDEQEAHEFYRNAAYYKDDFEGLSAVGSLVVDVANMLLAVEGGVGLVKDAATLAMKGISIVKSGKVISNVGKITEDLSGFVKNIFKRESNPNDIEFIKDPVDQMKLEDEIKLDKGEDDYKITDEGDYQKTEDTDVNNTEPEGMDTSVTKTQDTDISNVETGTEPNKGAGKAEIYTDDMRKYIIPPEDGFDALIERRYIDIRKAGFSDVSDIAKNTGLPEQDIIDMKNHLFFNTHELSVQGKPPEKLYFQGNANIAYGWEKAKSGELTKAEKDWFEALRNHELTEKKYMDDGMPLTDPSTWDPVKERQGTDPLKNAHDKANLTAEAPGDFPGYADIANKEWNKNYMNNSNDY